MPTKHVNKKTWTEIESLRMKGILELKTDIKVRELFDLILTRGIKTISDDDLKKLAIKEP